MTSEEKLQRELSDVRAELAEIRLRANTPFALVNDDRYWDLCLSERHLVRVLGEKHHQVARPQRSIASTVPFSRPETSRRRA